jgi:hypothetical protein
MMVAMDEVGRLFSLVGVGVEDQELLANLGKVVVNSTVLEYTIAVLVALTEGKRGDACDDRAVEIVKQTGGARSELPRLARTRPGIAWLCTETEQLLTSRNILVHSLILGHGQDGDQYVMAIYDPRRNTETVVTTHVVARHAEYFEQNCARFRSAISAEVADETS